MNPLFIVLGLVTLVFFMSMKLALIYSFARELFPMAWKLTLATSLSATLFAVFCGKIVGWI